MKGGAWLHRRLQDMTETFKKALVWLLLLSSAAVRAAEEPGLKLIPQPKTILAAPGDYLLGPEPEIVIEAPVLKN
jgi:hypothetical protein